MEFLGTDLSATMLQLAEEQRQKNALSNLKFQRADMYRLNEAVEPGFDLITWHLAMHHAADADAVVRVLNQIPRLLNPGGTFFVFAINRPKTGNLALMTADIFNRRQGDWYYHDGLDSYKAAFSYEEVEEIIARSALKSVRHVQPLLGNLFQAFYLSETDNSTTHRISSFRHLWQKADYLLLELFFSSLPGAKGEVVQSDASRPRTRMGSSKIASSDIIEILEIGARAMSAYNIQPWRFPWNGDEIFIYFMRHKNFFLRLEGVYYLMIGHLPENITRGAQSKGYRAEYEILSKASSIDEPCIKLRLINVDGQKQNIAYLIDRTTNRYAYSTRKIPESIKQEILNLSNHENIVIRFSEDDEKERFADILATLENYSPQEFKACF